VVRVEDSIIINRPIEVVFAYATDVKRFPEWAATVREAEQTSSGPMAAGATVRTVIQFLGRRLTVDQVITDFEPNRTMASKSLSGPVSGVITTSFEPANGGTKVTWAIEGESKGFFGMADPLLGQIFKRQIEAQLGTLKDLLEGSAVGAE
jgi:uncharacterized membrane protein